MPRRKRRESGTEVYHIIIRGNNKEKIFERDTDKISFTQILKKKMKSYPITIYAYCIMINHVHILIKSEIEVLARFMQSLKMCIRDRSKTQPWVMKAFVMSAFGPT